MGTMLQPTLRKQLGALLWKDVWITRIKRSPYGTILEFIIPLGLIGLLVFLRSQNSGAVSTADPLWKNETTYESHLVQTISASTLNSGGLTEDTRLLFTPNTSYTANVIKDAFGASDLKIEPFDHVDEFNKELKKGHVALAIAFWETNETHLQYKVRTTLAQYETTHLFSESNANKGPRSPDDRVLLGVMQSLFLAHLKQYNITSQPIYMTRFPYPRWLNDRSFASISAFIPLLYVYGYTLFVIRYIRRIIHDKHSRVKEYLRMMGLSDWVYWLNVFLNGFVSMLLVSIIAVIAFKIPLGNGQAVLTKSDPSLLLSVLLLHAAAATMFLIFLTVMFQSPVIGTLVGTLCWFLSLSISSAFLDPIQQNRYQELSGPTKLLTSLFLPNSGLYWCFKLINFREAVGVGAQWSTLYEPAVPGDNIVLGGIMSALLGACGIYGVLIFYLDNVWPWQIGIPKHPLFLFQKAYWTGGDEKSPDLTDILEEAAASDLFEKYSSSGGLPTVMLRKVCKYFGNKQVLHDIHLKMFEGEISVILGHNGAGKTTTMNILTGLYPPSSGELYINGFNVQTNTRLARKSVGLCPQHNVLFENLTVREHLLFFGRIKGASNAAVREEAEELVRKFELEPKVDILSKKLSGGMKRKLSMANAMVGGSSVIILDEPTAGMDPQARRMVWTVLQELRKGKTILLTTHYMEEADVLGDRITFLSAGTIMCSGSPIFLKKKFETGYKMRIAKQSSNADVNGALEVVRGLVGHSAVVEADMGYEYLINLGFPGMDKMVDLFKYFEEHKSELGIASLGVSVTTMEDVFLKVGAMGEASQKPGTNALPGSEANGQNGSAAQPYNQQNSEASSNGHALTNNDRSAPKVLQDTFPEYSRVTGFRLLLNQSWCLLVKRHDAAKRQWWLPVFMVLLPILTTSLFCIVDSRLAQRSSNGQNQITYDLQSLFGRTSAFVVGNSETVDAMHNEMKKIASVRRLNSSLEADDIKKHLLTIATADLSKYKRENLIGASIIDNDALNVWYNGEPYHVEMCALTIAQSAILGGQVRATYQPIRSVKSGAFNFQSFVEADFAPRLFCATFMSLSLAFITSSFIIFPVQENVSKAKLIQLMTGVGRWIYVLTSVLYDLGLHLLCSVFVVVTLVTGNPDGVFTVYNDIPGAILVLLLLFGFAVIPLAYLLSYFPKKSSSGFSLMVFLGMLVGMIGVLVITMLQILGRLHGNPLGINHRALQVSTDVLHFIPHFAVIWGLANIHQNGKLKKVCEGIHGSGFFGREFCSIEKTRQLLEKCCSSCPTKEDREAQCYNRQSPFAIDDAGAGWEMICLVITGCFLFVINIIVESNIAMHLYVAYDAIVRRIRRKDKPGKTEAELDEPPAGDPRQGEDDDVLLEKELVDELITGASSSEGIAMATHKLSKAYGSFRAVRNISFRVKEKECFGLLGVNGAGKTTTFRMLSGDLLMSAGNAYIGKCSLKADVKKFQEQIGYCPQFDALIDPMSGREMLRLFCLLRGVPLNKVDAVASFIIRMCDLEAHADKRTDSYSGGNKRKLSIGLAILGGPRVVFLDEPTAGIDPEARRKIWNALIRVQKELGSALVLTSHSMEECEALCDRLCIMVNGTFRCIGSTQRLKSKYGQGFTVLLKVRTESGGPNESQVAELADVVAKICEAMDELFPGENQLISSHQSLLNFHVTDTTISWSSLFSAVAELNTKFNLEDSIVSDTTLEQIFLNFAKTQFMVDE